MNLHSSLINTQSKQKYIPHKITHIEQICSRIQSKHKILSREYPEVFDEILKINSHNKRTVYTFY